MKLLKLLFLILIVVLFIFMPDFKSHLNKDFLLVYLIVFIAALVIHFLLQKDKNWFRLDVLFLIGFAIVHFQWSLMILNGVSPIYLQYIYYISDYITFGTWLSTISILMWMLGYNLIPLKKREKITYSINYKKLFWFTLLFFLLFLMTAGSGFFAGSVYKGEGGSATGAGISVYFQLLAQIGILALTSVVVLNNKDNYKGSMLLWLKTIDKKYLLLMVSYILIFLSVGDRGTSIQILMTFLILFGSLIRPISLKEFSIIIVTGAIVMTLIGLGRSAKSDENILLAGANRANLSTNYDITIELANSARTLYSALNNVPQKHDYFYGDLWIAKFLALIPMSQNIYMQLSDVKPYELGSAGYITYLRFGEHAHSGEGTSLIADIYLNFGITGSLVFMFLLGLFMKKLQNELNTQKNLYWLISAGMFASLVFYMSRSNLFVTLRPIIWGILLVYLFTKKENNQK